MSASGDRRQAGSPDFRSFLLHRRPVPHRRQLARRRAARGPAARTSSWTSAFVPEHRTPVAPRLRVRTCRCRAGSSTTGRCTACRGRWCSTWRSPRRCSARRAASSTRGSHETATRMVLGGRALADDPLTQRRLAEATWTVDAALTRMRADATELWQMAEARDAAVDGAASADALEHEPRLRAGRRRGRRPVPCGAAAVRSTSITRCSAASRTCRARSATPSSSPIRWPRPSAGDCSARPSRSWCCDRSLSYIGFTSPNAEEWTSFGPEVLGLEVAVPVRTGGSPAARRRRPSDRHPSWRHR